MGTTVRGRSSFESDEDERSVKRDLLAGHLLSLACQVRLQPFVAVHINQNARAVVSAGPNDKRWCFCKIACQMCVLLLIPVADQSTC